MDHTAFGVDFFGEEEQVVGPVVENEQTAVLHALAGDGNVGNVVEGHVNTGFGVEVIAEFHTD